MPLSNHHFDEDLLESYAMGQLPETQACGLEEHLLICHSCQNRLERTDEFIRAFRMAAAKRPSAPARDGAAGGEGGGWLSWFWNWRPLPVGAVMTMAALAVAMLAPRQTDWQGESTIALAAMRGSAGIASAPADRRLRLDLDTTALPGASYRIELADARGRTIWQSPAARTNPAGTIQAAVGRPVPAGLYWVRLYDPETGQLAREYGLRTQ
jgi:hypothetical protein